MTTGKKEILKSRFFQVLTQILLPIIAILLSVYFFVIGKEQKELTVTGLQITNLVETNNEVGNDVFVTYKLDTVYNTVRYLLEVKNTGNKSVTKQDIYNFNWIAPKDYQIVEVNRNSMGGSPVSYTINKPDSLQIDITALNKNNSIQLSILCLTKKKVKFGESKLDALISDCDIINKVNDFRKPIKESFWKTVFSGSFWVQVVKVIIYFIIGLLIALGIIFPIEKIQELVKKRKGEKNLSTVAAQLSLSKDVSVEYPERFAETYSLLSSLNTEEINVLYKIILAYDKSDEFRREVIAKKVLSESEKNIFDKLLSGEKSKTVKSVIDYNSIYYTERLLEYFKTGKITKPFSP